MTKFSNCKFLATLLLLSPIAVACSDDDDRGPETEPKYAVITFEEGGMILSGPTSAGENLYPDFGDGQFTFAEITVDGNTKMRFGLNKNWEGKYDFYAGGMVLSKWNERSQSTNSDWNSYTNQCSVYNLNSVDGANSGAGADGSNTFAIINGCWNEYGDGATIQFTENAEYRIESVQTCLTAYSYGCLAYPNKFGNNPDKTIEEVKGWFKVIARGFDAAGNATNNGNPVEFYLCDYRDNASPKVSYVTTWTSWDLSALGLVNKVEFDFAGSDTGMWGLNTPAYAALDNFMIKLPD